MDINNKIELRKMRRTIGRQLLRERQRQKLSLHTLAQQCGFGINRLDEIELGKRTVTLEQLALLATHMNIPLYQLLPSTGRNH
ncbi:MAG: helix-turn-helix transcriptional regulator [Rickettsiales bacterium]|nr:helix-turn-helix transcriptional regulator [Rickettsiales bacterium]